jgi:hypothetical protein
VNRRHVVLEPRRSYLLGGSCIVVRVETVELAIFVMLAASGCSTPEDTLDPAPLNGTAADGPSDEGTSAASTGSTSIDPADTTEESASAGVATEEDGSSGGLPEGPSCSVQVVTHGELFDPMLKGEEPGLVPTVVGDALEDYCGCHTLMDGAQNVELPFQSAPGGTLFLRHDDFFRPYKNTTLGEACASEVRGFRMPTGSCPFPDSAADLLMKWFDDGMPDGATFEPR